jgi:hypothetical protein
VTQPTLDHRALNRATLARQHLLERAALTPEDMVRHLVALQAQEPQDWYVTLWTRLHRFDPVAAGRRLEEKGLVRLTLLRGTVHLVTADDAPVLRRFAQPVIDRYARGSYARGLGNADLDELAVEVRQLTARPVPMNEMLDALHRRWPSADRQALSIAAKVVVPLVQAPPRGVWRRSGAVRLVALNRWLGRRLPEEVNAADLLKRYLAAYGPASVADAQAWSGLTRLREAFERLRPGLLTFRDPAGRELFDLPDAPRPPADTPAPPRFLAQYDNVLLAHADRTRFAREADRRAFTYVEGPYPSSLLVDGRYAGQWFLRREHDRATLTVRVPRPLSAKDESAVQREASSLLAFLVPEVPSPDVTFDQLSA